MSKKIYVGNLPFSASDDDLRELFGRYGEVVSVNLITDRETGRPRGFGFVEMTDEGAEEAIEKLNDTKFGGRTLKIGEAKPREVSGGGGGGGGGPRRGPRSGGGGYGGGGYGGGGGGYGGGGNGGGGYGGGRGGYGDRR